MHSAMLKQSEDNIFLRHRQPTPPHKQACGVLKSFLIHFLRQKKELSAPFYD